MQEAMFKGSLAGLGTIAAFMAGNFTPLVFLLIFAEVADYITGMYSAWLSKQLASDMAAKGFIKKIFYFFLVAAAFGFDFMIYEMTSIVGFSFEYPAMFGIFSICYLISTELISIIENLGEMGIRVPFLTGALRLFREKIDEMNGASDSRTSEDATAKGDKK